MFPDNVYYVSLFFYTLLCLAIGILIGIKIKDPDQDIFNDYRNKKDKEDKK